MHLLPDSLHFLCKGVFEHLLKYSSAKILEFVGSLSKDAKSVVKRSGTSFHSGIRIGVDFLSLYAYLQLLQSSVSSHDTLQAMPEVSTRHFWSAALQVL
jgi:galactitol-specific phosphotransferase system IIC component